MKIIGVKRHRLLASVPTLPELAQSDEGRQVLHAATSTGEIGRSILTMPGVPPERLAALRSAFQAMLNDPAFLAACEKRNLMIDGTTGEQITRSSVTRCSCRRRSPRRSGK
jgi:tripartite-type tricarboxylate transporter receptor subunit TctC